LALSSAVLRVLWVLCGKICFSAFPAANYLSVRNRATLLATLALLLAAQTARAQVITGTIVQPDSTTPLAGAIVVITDARSATIERVLTSSRGGFSVALPGPAQYSLTLLRIGYRPTVGPIVNVGPGETVRTRIVAGRAIVTLAAMRVRERETCRVSADTGLMVARVWEEARKAMLSSQLSAEGAPLYAEWVQYDRALDPSGRVIRQQRVRSDKHLTQHAFKSVPVDILRDQGYVAEDSVGVNYFAPDAEVLLSDAFVSAHCFQLVESPNNTDLVGVGFTPATARRDMRDIEGTLWVDRASSELRHVDFHYRNLQEPSSQAEPGGRVEFIRLAEGSWLVSRWHVRMPEVGKRDRVSQDGTRRTVMASTMLYLRAIRVSGGEVTRASRSDTVLYSATGPAVAVQLMSRDTLTSRTGAVLTIEGTDYAAIADSLGRSRFSPVLAGRYRATVRTPLMQTLGMPSVEMEVDTHDDARVDSLLLPSARDVLVHACPRESVANDEGMLHGRVRDEHARLIADAVVTTSWQSGFGAGRGVEYREKTLTSHTDAFGEWRTCGVPTGLQLSVTVATKDAADVQKIQLEDPYANVELVVHPRRLLTSDITSPIGTTLVSLVEVAVTDEQGAPVPNVSVEARQEGMRTRTLFTGEMGRVLLPDIRRDRLVVSARHVGFVPGELTVDLESERVLLPIRLATNSAPSLDTLRVIGVRANQARYSEFEMRHRMHQASVSITSEEIERRSPTAIWQMITNVPGVIVADRDNIVVARSQRAFMQNFSDQPCFLQVMVDGVIMNRLQSRITGSGFDLRQLPPPEQIHGIEVFNGPASMPVQYGGEGSDKWCGLIAVWTK
jgi:hypothetical protein